MAGGWTRDGAVQDQIDANRADAARAAVGVFRALGGGWDPRDQPVVRDAAASTSSPSS